MSSENPAGFSEAFWVGLTAGGFAFIGLVVRYCYKSKCRKISLCGITIERDIDAEKEEDIAGVSLNEPSTPLNPTQLSSPLPVPAPVRTTLRK